MQSRRKDDDGKQNHDRWLEKADEETTGSSNVLKARSNSDHAQVTTLIIRLYSFYCIDICTGGTEIIVGKTTYALTEIKPIA